MRWAILLMLSACTSSGALELPDAAVADASIADAAPPHAAPDLRFKWVGAGPSYLQASTTNVTFSGAGSTIQSHDGQMVFSPLQISMDGLVVGNDSWTVTSFSIALPTESMLSEAKAGDAATLDADLNELLDAHQVVVSIDLFSDAYGFVTQGTASGVPAYTTDTNDVPRADLDAWVASEAASGSVVTALTASPISGQVRVYATKRPDDATPYETLVLDVTVANLATQANVLATTGYIVTAFGRTGVGTGIVVGTRVPGAAPRGTSSQTTGAPILTSDAIVAWVFQVETPNNLVILEH